MDEIQAWFAGRLPDDWFEGPPDIQVDRDEIVVVGSLADVEIDADSGEAARESARLARIARWREETRGPRIRIAQEAERRYRRKVSWGASCGPERRLFTHLAAPVMTRLRIKERAVVDTLVEAGVARSRSEAVAWCVRLVGQHEDDWIARLREALATVETARAAGPAGA